MRTVLLALLVALIAGCGGSGGGSAVEPVPTPAPAPTPTTAIIEVSTQGPAPDTVIFATQFTLHLPAGVTVAADPTTGEVSSAVLHAVDSGAFFNGKYRPATSDAVGSVEVMIVDSGGFTAGKLATLTCNIASGSNVSPAGLSIDGFSALDENAATVPGITASLSVKTQ